MEEIKKEQLGIVVDDGSVEVPITNTHGKTIGVFYFRPTDFNIVKRYNEIADKFGEVVDPLINANIDTNGEGEDDKSVELLMAAQGRLFELVDYLLDGNASEAFFGSMNAFSPVGGKFYCENALEAVGNYISAKFDDEVKAISARVDKHTHGYKTGRHAKGRQ